MLHKSFKPAKCKTALNLAKSRIKLLKNKKEVQVKQLRRELAQLLESGQDQTARIRVEHVVREEKTMAAFELIEIYCELIVARLPIIESQKNCPLDLKEAITSLIFAAPRCGDIPELQDVRKLFTAKYGKEFVASAIELRPACGVSRIMVEKLSVKAPDGPTKVKILTAIAEEHNIQWEPKWFKDEVEVPSADLPKVQHTEKGNAIQMEPLNFEISDDPPGGLASDAARSATSSQSHVHADIGSSAVPHSASSRTDTRPERAGTAENVLLTARQNLNMEFKDATAAAQAAAESAERASMAARAAAELSTHGRIINDTYSGPGASSIYARSEGSDVYAGSGLQHEYVEKNHANSSFNHMSSKMQGIQRDANEQGNMKEGAEARSFKEEYTRYGIEGEDLRESKTSSYPVQDMRRQSRDSLFVPNTSRAESSIFESSNQEYGDDPAENPFHEETVKMENQPSSFQSQSSASEDEYSMSSQRNNKNKNDDQDDGSFGNFHQGTANYDDWHLEGAHNSGSYDVKDDTSFREQGKRATFLGSDEQKHVFQSRKDIFGSTDHTVNEMNVGKDIFGSTDHKVNEMNVEEMGTHTNTGVVFDESDSDDEYNIDQFQKLYDLPSPVKFSPKNFLFHEENSPENQGKQSSFSQHYPYGLEVSESFRESPIYAKLSEPLPITFDSDGEGSESEKEPQNEGIKSQKSQKSLRPLSQSSDPVLEFQHETQSSPEVGMELNFGQLPGGRRNRPLRNPPYTRTAVDDGFDARQKTKASFDEMENSQSPKETGVSHTQFATTSDDSDMVTVPKASNITERPYNVGINENVHKTSLKSPAWYFDSDDSGSEDGSKQSVTSKTILGGGLSRRTKASARRSFASSQTPDALDKLPEDSPNSPAETRFTSRNTDSLRWDDEAISRSRPQRRVSKSKEEEESLNPPKGAEISRASSSNEKAPSRENSTKNPGHVHPKLPDFESFTAHLQSLRTNRR